jgi:hypothetical protein
MRAMYEARIEDLGERDLVQVECACGHVERLTGSMDLERRPRCRECDAKGKVIVPIKWADALP